MGIRIMMATTVTKQNQIEPLSALQVPKRYHMALEKKYPPI
jgi:hypothetical protein